MDIKRFKVKLSNLEKLEELLQETYNLADQQYRKIQIEIDKIVSTTILSSLDIDGKEKYGKIINNYISLQQKAIAQKFDIAKLLSEISKHNGDVNGAVNEMTKATAPSLDLKRIRALAKEVNTQATDNVVEYKTK